jgi:hypothetical protein
MSTFYLLPPRPLLEESLTTLLKPFFPGLEWSRNAQSELADRVAMVAAGHDDIYVIHRDELPKGADAAQALIDGFGAGPNDEVIEVRPGRTLGQWIARRWRLTDAA